ncbi:uncharacterized protein LOC144866806 isoform X2 [Branchiostoma floridae x Branchiostoma japonicum]
MGICNSVRGTRTVMALLFAISATSNVIFPGCHAASTIFNVGTQSVTRGSPAEFPWNVTLDGVTIATVQWVKMPTTQLAVRTGSTFTVSSFYTGRVTNPLAETIILQNVTDADAGTYQCTVRLSDLTTVEDSADLIVQDPTTALPSTTPLSTTVPGDWQLGLAIGLPVAAVVIIGIIVGVIIWQKKTRVSQDLSQTGTHKQVKLEQKTTDPAQDVKTPANEVKIPDSPSKHGNPRMLPPLDLPKHKKKKKRKKSTAEKDKAPKASEPV